MDKIKRFIDCHVPITTCNLRCSYCYVAQQKLFDAKPMALGHSLDEIRKAFSQKRLGGICAINLCAGGETLISREVIDVVKVLLEEGHYVFIVSNGLLSQRYDEIATLPSDLLKRLFIKFSFHFMELKRLNAFDTFFENVHKMDHAGVSFTVEMVPHDELIPYIDEVQQVCMENLGALCHCTIGRSDIDPDQRIPHLSKYDFDEYLKIWSSFESELMEFKSQIFYKPQRRFCYAGEWSAFIHLGTGEITQCYCGERLGNIYEDMDAPLTFKAIGKGCTQAHCYNGHAFLAFGNIPELKTPTYGELRNRTTAQGTEWLKPEMKAFMDSRLCESNKKYSFWRKWKMNRKQKS